MKLDFGLGWQVLASGVNFTNILQAAFLFKNVLCSLSVLTVWVCNFWAKGIGAKALRKLLVKSTTGRMVSGIINAEQLWSVKPISLLQHIV